MNAQQLELPLSELNQRIELPPDYQETEETEALYNLLENLHLSCFITGKAGTGKSTFIKYFLKKSSKQVLCFSFTGIAALNIGGDTIHSFFRLPSKPLVPEDDEIRPFNAEQVEILKKTDALIIDEISMVRSDHLEAIDFCLRKALDGQKPFGGKQMIFVGDPFQLPPVQDDTIVGKKDFFTTVYRSEYFFDAPAYKKLAPSLFELTIGFRQDDPGFLDILNRIRDYSAGREDFKNLNRRYIPQLRNTDIDFGIRLCSTNKAADGHNQTKLDGLSGSARTFEGKIAGSFRDELLPAEIYLKLKAGAQVLFVKNHRPSDGPRKWVNGTIGRIEKLEDNVIHVKLANDEICEVERETWENREYSWDAKKKKVTSQLVGTFQQFPLKLAWAITIHKSQGLTFTRTTIDMGRKAFSPGQLYVALSRCKYLDKLLLTRPIRHEDMIPEQRITRFYRKVSDVKKKTGSQENENELIF